MIYIADTSILILPILLPEKIIFSVLCSLAEEKEIRKKFIRVRNFGGLLVSPLSNYSFRLLMDFVLIFLTTSRHIQIF